MMKSILNIAGILLTICLLSASYVVDVSNLEGVSFSKVSPVDGSVWIAVGDRGLVRVGRNHKVFSYSSEKGDFPCDTICALHFDADGLLWFLDARGEFYSYSSYQGFVPGHAPADIADILTSASRERVIHFPADEGSVLNEQQSDDRPVVWWWWVVLSLAGFAFFFWLGRLCSARKERLPAGSPAPLPVGNIDVIHARHEASEIVTVDPVLPPDSVSSITIGSEVAKSKVTKLDTQSFYNEVVSYVEQNYSDSGFCVEDIAEHFGISRVHLNRKLKACNVESPSSIIKSARMKRASELLKSGQYSILEVSLKCGFSSSAYFSTAFKDYYGQSPSSLLQ